MCQPGDNVETTSSDDRMAAGEAGAMRMMNAPEIQTAALAWLPGVPTGVKRICRQTGSLDDNPAQNFNSPGTVVRND